MVLFTLYSLWTQSSTVSRLMDKEHVLYSHNEALLIKMNRITLFSGKLMQLGIVKLREWRQIQKKSYWVFYLTHRLGLQALWKQGQQSTVRPHETKKLLCSRGTVK